MKRIYTIRIHLKEKKGSEILNCPFLSMKTLVLGDISDHIYDFIFQKYDIKRHKIKPPKIQEKTYLSQDYDEIFIGKI